jgi:hypothetical protein
MIAEGYTISVQCDGQHQPGLGRRDEFYGMTKGEAHAALRKAGWRLGPDCTAYCRACRLKMPRGVEGQKS